MACAPHLASDRVIYTFLFRGQPLRIFICWLRITNMNILVALQISNSLLLATAYQICLMSEWAHLASSFPSKNFFYIPSQPLDLLQKLRFQISCTAMLVQSYLQQWDLLALRKSKFSMYSTHLPCIIAQHLND